MKIQRKFSKRDPCNTQNKYNFQGPFNIRLFGTWLILTCIAGKCPCRYMLYVAIRLLWPSDCFSFVFVVAVYVKEPFGIVLVASEAFLVYEIKVDCTYVMSFKTDLISWAALPSPIQLSFPISKFVSASSETVRLTD